jgi:TRAP-type C4-dicarboxylate transport system substrate-binding protein
LQQGLVEAQDNNFQVSTQNKFHEQCKYATQTYHMAVVGVYSMNLDWFNGLTPAQQKLIMDAWDYADKKKPEARFEEMRILDWLKKDFNYEVYEFTPEDIAKGRELTQPVWNLVKRDVKPEIFNAFLAAIDRARAAK